MIFFIFRCRGEIFWIHKQGGGYIHSCDVVALEYKTGWWLSCADHNVGEACKTRTCPGEMSGDSNWNYGCTNEMFRIRAVNGGCGYPITNGAEVVLFTNERWGAVSHYWRGVTDSVQTGRVNPRYEGCFSNNSRCQSMFDIAYTQYKTAFTLHLE